MGEWIPWLQAYEVNVSEIDEQHKELFRMFNELMDATWDGKGKGAIRELLEFTANYAVTHFGTEEKCMQRYGYPGYVEHKKLHDDFTAGVVKFLGEYDENGITTDMVVTVISGLGKWTREHIRDVDQELGRFLASRLQTN
jgi:hemerythrin-like metal-binding protein